MHEICFFLRKMRNVENCSVAFHELQISDIYSRINHCLQCKNSVSCHRYCNSSLSRHCTQHFTHYAFLPTAAELDLLAPSRPAAAAIDIHNILIHFAQFCLVPAASSWPFGAASCAQSPMPCLRVHRVLYAPLHAIHLPIDSMQLLKHPGYSCTRRFRRRAVNMENGLCVAPYIYHLHLV